MLSACFTADGSPLTVSQKNFSLLKMSLVARDANNKAGPRWETGGGAHTLRGVRGILGLTMGGLSVGVW